MKKLLFAIALVSVLFMACSNSTSSNSDDEPVVTEQKEDDKKETPKVTPPEENPSVTPPQETPAETSQDTETSSSETTQTQEPSTTEEPETSQTSMEFPSFAPEGFVPLDTRIWNPRNVSLDSLVATDDELVGRNYFGARFGLMERFEGTVGIVGKYRKQTGNNTTLELWIYDDGRMITVEYETENPDDKTYTYYHYSLSDGYVPYSETVTRTIDTQYFENYSNYYTIYLKASPNYLGWQ